MTSNRAIKVESGWDKNVVPANCPRKRGLLVDISGFVDKPIQRHSVNLCLVIDRSGSMGGGRIEAAKEAARGVVERLGEQDVLSIVDFDSEITTLIRSLRMSEAGKTEAVSAIDTLHARRTTNLAGGWLEGATRVAEVVEQMAFKNGHVVLLSDGHANVGIQDPKVLRAHADEMASRGITTSTVGIGDGYSPLQLEALSEGGLGRLHDAANPEEIVETILGELGEVLSIVATHVELRLSWHQDLRAELLASFDASQIDSTMTVRLGQLAGGSRRTIPFMFNVPPLPVGEVVNVEIEISCKDPETGESMTPVTAVASLKAVPLAESLGTERDTRVAERIARLWESTVGFYAIQLNERQHFEAAGNLVQDACQSLLEFAAGTGAERDIRRNLHAAQRKVRRPWDGRSKREALVAAKKFSKAEPDHRSSPKGDWSDHL